MGPHFFKCGKNGKFFLIFRTASASMGPHFFKCGKPSIALVEESMESNASMGPHFFKCGKWTV